MSQDLKTAASALVEFLEQGRNQHRTKAEHLHQQAVLIEAVKAALIDADTLSQPSPNQLTPYDQTR